MIIGGFLVVLASISLAVSISQLQGLKASVNGKFTEAIRPEVEDD